MTETLTALLAANPVERYLRFLLADDPFRGLYNLNAFDLFLLIPYFAILGTLAFYGLHRYRMIYLYKKYAHRQPPLPAEPAEWPMVTVQLPLYNEKYVVERLIDTVAALDYPRERLEIQVLDDSTADPGAAAQAGVERWAAAGLTIRPLQRSPRAGYKAGALADGLKKAQGEFIAVFDADFLPPADVPRRTVPYYADPQLAMVQTRWSYVNRHYSLLTE